MAIVMDTEYCWMRFDFLEWSDVFVCVLIGYLWNISILIWTLPWFGYPSMGLTLQPIFQSDTFGISLSNWRRIGRSKLNRDEINKLSKRTGYQFYTFIYALNVWIIFAAKVCIMWDIGGNLTDAFTTHGFKHFFNWKIILLSLLCVSDFFFSFPMFPVMGLAARRANIIRLSLYAIYAEMFATFILLCIRWPLLLSSLYIGACIVLTSFLFGMAVLCLVAFIAIIGTVIYWVLSVLLFWLPMYFGSQWRAYIRSISAGLTWLAVTYMVWVTGICLALLFTNSEFSVHICLRSNNAAEMTAFGLIWVSLIWTLISFVVMIIGERHKWAVNFKLFTSNDAPNRIHLNENTNISVSDDEYDRISDIVIGDADVSHILDSGDEETGQLIRNPV